MSELTPFVGLLARIIIGSVLLIAGVRKLRNRAAFAQTLQPYRWLPERARGPFSLFLPLVEVLVAVTVLSGMQLGMAALAAAAIFLLFTLATIATFGVRGQADCGCLGGAVRQVPVSLLAGRNIALVVLAAVFWAADSLSSGDIFLLVAFVASVSAFALSSAPWKLNLPRTAPGPETETSRRRFLRVALSSVAGLAAASALGVLEKKTAEAACYGCGTCGTDYIFLYCNMPCCAIYWVRPYNYCQTSCPPCNTSYQMFCGIQICC